MNFCRRELILIKLRVNFGTLERILYILFHYILFSTVRFCITHISLYLDRISTIAISLLTGLYSIAGQLSAVVQRQAQAASSHYLQRRSVDHSREHICGDAVSGCRNAREVGAAVRPEGGTGRGKTFFLRKCFMLAWTSTTDGSLNFLKFERR